MVTITGISQVTESSWRVTYSSDVDGATFYIFVDGQLIGQTDQTFYDIEVTDSPPVIDVLDTPAPPTAYPRVMVIAWYAVSGAGSYRVEEQIGSDWLIRATLPDDGRGYFKFTSRSLEDSQTHNFRVTAVGENQNLGTVATLSALMVRIPDPPGPITVAYNAGTGAATFSM